MASRAQEQAGLATPWESFLTVHQQLDSRTLLWRAILDLSTCIKDTWVTLDMSYKYRPLQDYNSSWVHQAVPLVWQSFPVRWAYSDNWHQYNCRVLPEHSLSLWMPEYSAFRADSDEWVQASHMKSEMCQGQDVQDDFHSHVGIWLQCLPLEWDLYDVFGILLYWHGEVDQQMFLLSTVCGPLAKYKYASDQRVVLTDNEPLTNLPDIVGS